MQFLLLVVLIQAFNSSAQLVRYVKPNDSSLSCPGQPCLTLDQYTIQKKTYFTTGSIFEFLAGIHSPQNAVNLSNISDLTLRGKETDIKIICRREVTFLCENVTSFKVENLTFVILHNRLSFLITNSKRVLISGSMFIQSVEPNMTATRALYSKHSEIMIISCLFEGCNGGAIYARYESNITVTSSFFTRNKARFGGAFRCGNCTVRLSGNNTFMNNSAHTGGAILLRKGAFFASGSALFSSNKASLAGGAVYLSNSTALLSGTGIEFRDNLAIHGGGIYSFASQLLTRDTLSFVGNVAQERGGALGMSTAYTYTQPSLVSGNFINNTAKCGGGAHIGHDSTVTFKSIAATGNSKSAFCFYSSNVTFYGTTKVLNNTGMLGGGIDSRNSYITFENYTVFGNNTASSGGGIYLLFSKVSFSGIVLFTRNRVDNDGGALCAIGTDVSLWDTVNFTFNSANNGGAMNFKNAATLTLQKYTNLTTSHNHASEYGGAIYNEDTPMSNQCDWKFGTGAYYNEEITELPNCFMQLIGARGYRRFYTFRISSYDDSAVADGDFLYGGLLDRCQLKIIVYTYLSKTIMPYTFITNNFLHVESRDTERNHKPITSPPYRLCFCVNSQNYNCSTVQNVEVHKGQKFTVSLLSIDQGNTSISTLVTALVGESAQLKLTQSLQSIKQHCTNVNYNVYSTESQEELILYPNGPCHDTGLARAVINVTLLPCPDAFTQSGEQCICEERLQTYGADCLIDENIYINREAGSKFWMSALYVNESYQGLILYKTCPAQYCTNDTVHITLENLDIQCDLNRSGVLCGACATNYSLMLGSSQCHVCSNTYLALLLPFAAAGIALVVFLTFVRLTVATGMINSLILYANIVQVNKTSILPINTGNVLTVFIAWMNLDLGFQTCFYDGMDTYVQIWLQFTFPMYVWIIISLIILTSRYSMTISKLIGHNPIAVLATLLLMSYTKILKIIIEVYSSVDLDYPDNKMVRVWLKDANVPYLQSKHLLLAVVTSLVLVFLFLPYTFLLLLGHKLYRFSGRKYFCWLNRIKPLLDSYYAPYESHTRYWTGFLLLVRCALYIVFSFNSLGATSRSLLAIIITFTAVMIFAWLSVKLYKNLYANVIEVSVYFNLITLSAATATNCNSPALVYTLVGIVFATMIGVIVYHFHLLYTAKSVIWLKLRAKVFALRETIKTGTADRAAYQPLVDASTKDLNSSHDPHKIITKTVVSLREPLLEDY